MAGENKKYIKLATTLYGNTEEIVSAVEMLKLAEKQIEEIPDFLFDIIWDTAIHIGIKTANIE